MERTPGTTFTHAASFRSTRPRATLSPSASDDTVMRTTRASVTAPGYCIGSGGAGFRARPAWNRRSRSVVARRRVPELDGDHLDLVPVGLRRRELARLSKVLLALGLPRG